MVLPTEQQVLMLRKFGGPDGLSIVSVPLPEPGAGELLVKVLAASVQFTDIIIREGRYPGLRDKPPLVLGYDLVGEVVKVGPGVNSSSVGERVADMTITGSYAQYRVLQSVQVVPVDPALDPAQATSLVLSWTTAYQLLHRDALVRHGQRLLVIGAAGAVGQALVVLGKLAGCEVWGTGHARHNEVIQALGAVAVDSDTANFATLLPEKFDVVFDGIGERGFSRAWNAVGPYGRLSAFGFSAGVQRKVPIMRIGFWLAKLWWWNTFSGRRSAGFFSVTAVRAQHPDWFTTALVELLGMLKRGLIEPRVAERVALAAVADAQSRLERGGLEGKIVLIPNG